MIERFFTRTKRPRHGRRRPRAVLTLTMFGLGLIGLAALARPAPWLVWTASASAPIGLYRVFPGNPASGDLGLVRPPDSARQLAADRGYLPLDVPLVKRVAALAGDTIRRSEEPTSALQTPMC